MLAHRTLETTKKVDKYLGNKMNTNYVRKKESLWNSGIPMWMKDLSWTPPPDTYYIRSETALDCKETTKHKNSCKYSIGKELRPPAKQDALILATATLPRVGPGKYTHHT